MQKSSSGKVVKSAKGAKVIKVFKVSKDTKVFKGTDNSILNSQLRIKN